MGSAAGPGSAGLGAVVWRAPKVGETRQAGLGDQGDITPASAVSTVGTATWNMGLSAEGARPIPAAAAGYVNPDPIREHRLPIVRTPHGASVGSGRRLRDSGAG